MTARLSAAIASFSSLTCLPRLLPFSMSNCFRKFNFKSRYFHIFRFYLLTPSCLQSTDQSPIWLTGVVTSQGPNSGVCNRLFVFGVRLLSFSAVYQHQKVRCDLVPVMTLIAIYFSFSKAQRHCVGNLISKARSSTAFEPFVCPSCETNFTSSLCLELNKRAQSQKMA